MVAKSLFFWFSLAISLSKSSVLLEHFDTPAPTEPEGDTVPRLQEISSSDDDDRAMMPKRGVTTSLSSVVVFGDSFSDDGHRIDGPAPNPYSPLGSSSQGVTWPRKLVADLTSQDDIDLNDYACNGAQANKALLNRTSDLIPDTKEQIEDYLTQLDHGQVEATKGKTLVMIWVGINPINIIWQTACATRIDGTAGATSVQDMRFQNALHQVYAQASELRKQIVRISSSLQSRQKGAAAYVLVTVPPLQRSLLEEEMSVSWSRGDQALATKYLSLLETLIEQYNQAILAMPEVLRASHGPVGLVRVYDITALWTDILSSPNKYDLVDISEPCLVNSTVCERPDGFFFWDTLHVGPHIHKIIADHLAQFLVQ